MSAIQKCEQNTPLDQRLNNINQNFSMVFNQAYKDGKITKNLLDELGLQVQKHREALQRSMTDPNMRAEIKGELLGELIESYYDNVHDLYQDAISNEEEIL